MKDRAAQLHRRVQTILVTYENVGPQQYDHADALWDIKQAYQETFGPADQWIKEKSK